MKTFTIEDDGIKKGIAVKAGPSMTLFGIPLGQAIHKVLEQEKKGTLVKLHNLDVIEEKQGEEEVPARIVFEARPRDNRALIVLDTHLEKGEAMFLLSNDLKSTINEKMRRVVRGFPSVEEAVGVNILAHGTAEDGQCYLLTMFPGSSFRIARTDSKGIRLLDRIVAWQGRAAQHADHPRWFQEVADFESVRDNPENWGLTLKQALRN